MKSYGQIAYEKWREGLPKDEREKCIEWEDATQDGRDRWVAAAQAVIEAEKGIKSSTQTANEIGAMGL